MFYYSELQDMYIFFTYIYSSGHLLHEFLKTNLQYRFKIQKKKSFQYIFINFAVTASITHIALFHGKEIRANFKAILKDMWRKKEEAVEEEEHMDPHMKMMSFYKEVPTWWYYLV